MQDSNIANNGGLGGVDTKRFKKIAQKWGSLPQKERQRIVQDLTRGMSDKHRQAIEAYFKRLSNAQK